MDESCLSNGRSNKTERRKREILQRSHYYFSIYPKNDREENVQQKEEYFNYKKRVAQVLITIPKEK